MRSGLLGPRRTGARRSPAVSITSGRAVVAIGVAGVAENTGREMGRETAETGTETAETGTGTSTYPSLKGGGPGGGAMTRSLRGEGELEWV
jgi:hypothetical protein